MNEENKPTTTGESKSDSKKIADVIFDGKTYTINKLKAGKFYKALKVYMEMIKGVAPETQVMSKEGEKEATVDFNRLVESMFQSWPEKMAEFVVVCCSNIKFGEDKPLTKESMLEEAYPEEIPAAFIVCMDLNNVAANLKNYVAPIGSLGAGLKDKPKQNKG